MRMVRFTFNGQSHSLYRRVTPSQALLGYYTSFPTDQQRLPATYRYWNVEG